MTAALRMAASWMSCNPFAISNAAFRLPTPANSSPTISSVSVCRSLAVTAREWLQSGSWLGPRYGRLAKHAAADKVVPSAVGHRHGRRSRSLTGTFGRVGIEVPRARLEGANGRTTEWQSKVLRAYQRRTLAADALIASTYLSGTNTRRVRRALKALFGGARSKDTVSRIWRKVKADWDAWNARSLAAEPIVRLILDGTVVDVRLDRKATAISP